MKNLHTIQLLRFIAATLVVIFHSYKELIGLELNFPEALNFTPFGQVGVHIFFVISGFIMVYTSWDRFERPGAVKTFLILRCLRIFPIFWIFNTLYFLFCHYANKIFSEVSVASFLLSYTLFPNYSSLALGPAWTLSFEMFFYIIFSVSLVFKVEKSIIFISSFFLCLVSVGLFIPIKSYFIGFLTNVVLLEFILGMFIGYCHMRSLLSNNYAWLMIISGALLLSVGAVPDVYNSCPKFIVWGVPSSLLIYGMIMQENKKPISIINKISFLGDSSYTLYLMHTLTIYLVNYSNIVQTNSVHLPGELFVFFVTGFCIISSIYIHNHVEKPITFFLKQQLLSKK